MTLESLLIDLILAVIIGLAVYFSARRGFVRTFIEAAGFVAAAVLAFTICTPLASATYDKIIEPPLLAAAGEEVHSSLDDAINNAWDKLPDFIENYAQTQGIVPSEVLDESTSIESSAHKIVSELSQNTIKPIAVRLISAVYSLVTLTVLLVVVKFLAASLNKVFSFSLVGKLNTVLGGVCGLVKGLAFAFALCLLIYTIISFTQNGIWIFNTQNIDKTFIFKYLISLIKI